MASAADIKALRERTGAGILDCKKALAESGDDMEAAIDWLRTKGIAKAAKKATRIASEGLVEAYIHGEGRIGVLLEVNCETDFVALNDNFKALVRDIAMHIAASSPEYVSRDEIPADAIERERAVQRARVIDEGKPEKMADKIVDGRISKWFQDVCLLEQPFIKADDKTVEQVVADAIAMIGENIKVRRFVRFEVGEGLQKKSDDFAAEVAAVSGGKA